MKTLTVSMITLGIAAAMGISDRDVSGDHGPPDVQTQIEPGPGPTPADIPRTDTADVAPTNSGCRIVRPTCSTSACYSSRRTVCRVAPAEVAAELHTLSLILAEDIDFDLYGSRAHPHLIRGAESVIRDVIAVRRALAHRHPIEGLTADLRNVSSSLEHLDRSIGRRYRTRAIHFALSDAGSAFDELTETLGVDLRPDANPPTETETAPPRGQERLEPSVVTEPPISPATPQIDASPVTPALRSVPELPPVLPNTLIIPETADRPAIPENVKGLRQLTLPEQRLTLKQRTCPVTGDLLGSMGKPIKVNKGGRTVFVCCQGCVEELQSPS